MDLKETASKLADALQLALKYRAHLDGCEHDMTDFCTCGRIEMVTQATEALDHYKNLK